MYSIVSGANAEGYAIAGILFFRIVVVPAEVRVVLLEDRVQSVDVVAVALAVA